MAKIFPWGLFYILDRLCSSTTSKVLQIVQVFAKFLTVQRKATVTGNKKLICQCTLCFKMGFVESFRIDRDTEIIFSCQIGRFSKLAS